MKNYIKNKFIEIRTIYGYEGIEALNLLLEDYLETPILSWEKKRLQEINSNTTSAFITKELFQLEDSDTSKIDRENKKIFYLRKQGEIIVELIEDFVKFKNYNHGEFIGFLIFENGDVDINLESIDSTIPIENEIIKSIVRYEIETIIKDKTNIVYALDTITELSKNKGEFFKGICNNFMNSYIKEFGKQTLNKNWYNFFKSFDKRFLENFFKTDDLEIISKDLEEKVNSKIHYTDKIEYIRQFDKMYPISYDFDVNISFSNKQN